MQDRAFIPFGHRLGTKERPDESPAFLEPWRLSLGSCRWARGASSSAAAAQQQNEAAHAEEDQ